MMTDSTRIFLVDDDDSMRKSLSRLLQSAGYGVEAFASAREFLDRYRYDCPGCIVLDIRMPGMSGLDVQEEFQSRAFSLPIVFITGHGDIPMGIRAMKKGAVDFLEKPVDEEDLLNAIELAIEKDRRQRAGRSELQQILKHLESLTPREFEVMTYVAAGCMNKEIAAELGIALKTVKIHRGQAMRKLDVDSVADLVRLAEKAEITLPEKC